MTNGMTAVAVAIVAVAASWPIDSKAEREHFNVDNTTYRSKCGSCHIAYPPQLLPADAWQRLMSQLDKHFGSEASIDTKTAREIETYLEANAARRVAGGKPTLRISETRWFLREHNEVPARVWKSPAVKSASNCAACHTKAEQGDFSERTLRVPK